MGSVNVENDDKITSEKKDGPTPNGGAYSIGYYMNDEGMNVPKDEATQIIIKEYSADGIIIQTTHGGFSMPKSKPGSGTTSFML
jgi:hypothetical protein